MARTHKLLDQILRGDADANIPFSGMVEILHRLGFEERVRVATTSSLAREWRKS